MGNKFEILADAVLREWSAANVRYFWAEEWANRLPWPFNIPFKRLMVWAAQSRRLANLARDLNHARHICRMCRANDRATFISEYPSEYKEVYGEALGDRQQLQK